jgi:hypothetical protein
MGFYCHDKNKFEKELKSAPESVKEYISLLESSNRRWETIADIAIKKYKEQYNTYWRNILETDGDFDLVDEDETEQTKIDKDLANIRTSEDDNSQED